MFPYVQTTSGTEPSPSYPRAQVAQLISTKGDREGGDTEAEGDRRTPVDLQDIVEKLNNAIKDARIKNNLKLDQLSPVHDKLGAQNEEN